MFRIPWLVVTMYQNRTQDVPWLDSWLLEPNSAWYNQKCVRSQCLEPGFQQQWHVSSPFYSKIDLVDKNIVRGFQRRPSLKEVEAHNLNFELATKEMEILIDEDYDEEFDYILELSGDFDFYRL